MCKAVCRSQCADPFCRLQCYYRPQTKFAKVMFLHVSVILSKAGGCEGVVSQHALQVVSQHALQQVSGGVSQHALQVFRPTPGGLSRPTPRGCIPACTEADSAHPGRLLLRALRILLGCILVHDVFHEWWMAV